MNEAHVRFVAHLDILGMSAIVEKDADEARGMLSDLVAVRDRVASYAMEFLETKELVRAPDVAAAVTFSDTIVLFFKGATDTELRALIILVTELFHKAMCSCVPLRAGNSRGKFFVNIEKSMYAGPALIEAYRVGESAHRRAREKRHRHLHGGTRLVARQRLRRAAVEQRQVRGGVPESL